MLAAFHRRVSTWMATDPAAMIADPLRPTQFLAHPIHAPAKRIIQPNFPVFYSRTTPVVSIQPRRSAQFNNPPGFRFNRRRVCRHEVFVYGFQAKTGGNFRRGPNDWRANDFKNDQKSVCSFRRFGLTTVVILEARPTRVFDRAVTQALPRWKFNPGADGRSYEAEINFKL